MIRLIDADEYLQRTEELPYYRSRWSYLSKVSEIAADLISRYELRSALELGPYKVPMVLGADVMDVAKWEVPGDTPHVILHDASKIPWPIQVKYDLFLALQVLEHLDADQDGVRIRNLAGIQREAFKEITRISRYAIISLPIDWSMDNLNDCHHMISHNQALSWFEPRIPDQVVIVNDTTRKRVIYVFEELKSGNELSATGR